MTIIDPIAEVNDDQNSDENPGHYISAFFPIVKAGDPSVVHRDDQYIRLARRSSIRDHIGFINSQMYGPNEPLYMVVLYQQPGNSDFIIRLMPLSEEHGPSRSIGMQEIQIRDRMDYRKVTNRWVWMAQQGDYSGRDRFVVNRDGNSVKIFLRRNNSLFAAASFSGDMPEDGVGAWKIGDERELNLTVTYFEPFEVKRIFIPSKEEMLSGTEYADINFKSIEFNSMNLRGCNLLRANFSNSKIVNANFDTARIESSNFGLNNGHNYNDPRLRGCSFIGSNLSKTSFNDRFLDNCKFTRANLTETSFKNVHLSGCNFQGADLTRTDFSGVDFNGVTFDGTLNRSTGAGTIFKEAKIPYPLIGNNWQNLNLSKAIFSGTFPTGIISAIGTSLIGSQLPNFSFIKADFTNANLSGANLRGANLTEANFTGADLTGADLTGATLTRAIFSGTKLASTILNEANLTDVTFTTPPVFGRATDARTRLHGTTVHVRFLGNNWSYIDLANVKLIFTNADIPKSINAQFAILDGLTFNGTDFENIDLQFATLKSTRLPNVKLAGAKMQSSTLIGTVFTNANMKGANLEGADLTNASFEGVELYGNNSTLKGVTAINVSFNDAYLANLNFSDIKGKALQGCNFSGSCLVNAVFDGTNLGTLGDVASGGKITSFANASLQGASFDKSVLTEVNLTNAAIATAPGDFNVSIRSSSVPMIKFRATKMEYNITSRLTTCPSGDSGPCNVDSMKTKSPFTNSWSHKALRKDTEE